jgi:hypothetical protein
MVYWDPKNNPDAKGGCIVAFFGMMALWILVIGKLPRGRGFGPWVLINWPSRICGVLACALFAIVLTLECLMETDAKPSRQKRLAYALGFLAVIFLFLAAILR